MNRRDMKDCFGLIAQISQAVTIMPYNAAVAAKKDLDALHEMIGMDLPGGWYGQCEGCETLLGNDDEFSSADDGDFCAGCIADWNQPAPRGEPLPTV